MLITDKAWTTYIDMLRKVHTGAAQKMVKYLNTHEWWRNEQTKKEAVDYAFALATQYGEAASAAACEFCDIIAADFSGALPAAIPADTATYNEVARAVYGTMKYDNVELIAGAVERLVKLAGVDTTLNYAIQNGGEWAWIPHGETCAFCLMLASNGWQPASKAVLKGRHAEHIHAHCDCTFAIRFDSETDVEGYNPDKYLRMYYDAPLDGDKPTAKNRLRALRREVYAESKDGLAEA